MFIVRLFGMLIRKAIAYAWWTLIALLFSLTMRPGKRYWGFRWDVLRRNCLRVSDFFTDSDAEISDEQVETLLHGIAVLNANDAAKETAKGELP